MKYQVGDKVPPPPAFYKQEQVIVTDTRILPNGIEAVSLKHPVTGKSIGWFDITYLGTKLDLSILVVLKNKEV